MKLCEIRKLDVFDSQGLAELSLALDKALPSPLLAYASWWQLALLQKDIDQELDRRK